MVLRHDRTIPLAPKSYQRTPWRCRHAVLFNARSLRMVAKLEFEILSFLNQRSRAKASSESPHPLPIC
jgi:hypothetical protein